MERKKFTVDVKETYAINLIDSMRNSLLEFNNINEWVANINWKESNDISFLFNKVQNVIKNIGNIIKEAEKREITIKSDYIEYNMSVNIPEYSAMDKRKFSIAINNNIILLSVSYNIITDNDDEYGKMFGINTDIDINNENDIVDFILINFYLKKHNLIRFNLNQLN